jgi:hypothetical protein
VVFSLVVSSASGQSGHSNVIGVGSIHGVAASSAILRARSTACFSGESCIGVRGEPCGVKVGDTALSSIQVARSTLCSIERDEVDWIIDRSSGLSLTRSRH